MPNVHFELHSNPFVTFGKLTHKNKNISQKQKRPTAR